jgi:hypothetical protein
MECMRALAVTVICAGSISCSRSATPESTAAAKPAEAPAQSPAVQPSGRGAPTATVIDDSGQTSLVEGLEVVYWASGSWMPRIPELVDSSFCLTLIRTEKHTTTQEQVAIPLGEIKKMSFEAEVKPYGWRVTVEKSDGTVLRMSEVGGLEQPATVSARRPDVRVWLGCGEFRGEAYYLRGFQGRAKTSNGQGRFSILADALLHNFEVREITLRR